MYVWRSPPPTFFFLPMLLLFFSEIWYSSICPPLHQDSQGVGGISSHANDFRKLICAYTVYSR